MAMVDMFLKLDGINGEAKDDKHKDEIDIEVFTLGVANGSLGHAGGGHGAGKADFQDITITKRADLSSPKLMQACAKGTHIAKGLITVRKAGGEQEEYYTVKLENVFVTSFLNTGSGGDAIPVEHLSLNFQKIDFQYKEQLPDGGTGKDNEFKWDIKANKAL